MKKYFVCLVVLFSGFSAALQAQWQYGNFISFQETVLPDNVFIAGRERGAPFYITKVEHGGNTYITKIVKGATVLAVPNANLGTIGSKNNKFLLYCGNARWTDAGNGQVPAGAAVVSAGALGNVYIARLRSPSGASVIGWVQVGQTEAEYLEEGNPYRSASYQLLVDEAVVPPPPATTEAPKKVLPTGRNTETNRKPVVVLPNGNNNNGAQTNANTGGITLVFVYENGNPANPRNSDFVNIKLLNESGNLVKQYYLESEKGEIYLHDLAPGRYSATIEAGYVENPSGNREGWTMNVYFKVSPNPARFQIRAGVVSNARVVLKK